MQEVRWVMNKIQNGLSKESKSVFWRWYFLGGAGWNYEKMQGLGYFYSMLPMIKKQKDEEDRKNLAKTELQFFNTNNTMAPIIMGVDCALQDETGADAADTIAALKTGMMGPLAGIGDSLIVGTLIPILLGIAMGLSQGGSPLGAIFYIVVWNVLAYFGMRFAYYRGYDLGGAAVEALVGPNATALRESIVMIGTMVIGAVAATWVNITTAMTLPGGGALQGTLDGIFPKLLPLGFTLLCWWLMAKKKVSPIVTMLILLAVAFIGAAVGFFGAATIAAPVA